MALYEDGDSLTAQQQLRQLAHKYPRSKTVLLILLEVSQEIQDWRTFAYYSEQLLPLERGEDRADTLNNLVYAYTQLSYPALAWYYAKELVIQHPDFEQVGQVRSFVEVTEPILLQEVEETMDAIVFTQDEKIELMVLHDRVRFLLESGYPEDAIQTAEALLDKVPDMIPILNNLSLSQFLAGDVERAISTAEKVITQDPDNFHALGNLVRYYFLTAQFDQAQAYAKRLQQITGDNPDLELKKAEAFAFLGDDEGVWAAYERAKKKDGELPPLLLHLAAAASYRLGDEKTAWRLWREAVKLAPSLGMAQECLDEKRLPVGERDVPWYWPFQYWFSQDFRELLERHLGKNVRRLNEKGVKRVMTALLAERPYLPQLFPHLLRRGDRRTREFVKTFIQIVETPEMLQTLYDFARSRYGADDLRMEAIQFISQNYPAMLPENKQVAMWVNGRQTELIMLDFEITDEIEWVEGVSEEILEKHEVAFDLLMNDDPEAADTLLHEIIAEAPEYKSAYNHLAVVYEQQGRQEEARALVEQTHARFPDYLFARVAMARMMAGEKKLEEARKLLEPVLRRQRLHISEFRALASAQMDIAIGNNQAEVARTWLEMWRQIEEGNPELIHWEMRIEGSGQLLQGLKKLADRSRSKRR